jgi:hypothetical protein
VRTRCIRAGRAPVNNWLDAHLAILSGARTDDRKSARRSTGFSLSSESRPLCLAFIPFLLRESEAIEETVRSPGLRMMRERQRATESDRERQRAAERERERERSHDGIFPFPRPRRKEPEQVKTGRAIILLWGAGELYQIMCTCTYSRKYFPNYREDLFFLVNAIFRRLFFSHAQFNRLTIFILARPYIKFFHT